MGLQIQNSRISLHAISGAGLSFSIPPGEDFTVINGLTDWAVGGTQLCDREIGLNTTDQRAWVRMGSQIQEFMLIGTNSYTLGPLQNGTLKGYYNVTAGNVLVWGNNYNDQVLSLGASSLIPAVIIGSYNSTIYAACPSNIIIGGQGANQIGVSGTGIIGNLMGGQGNSMYGNGLLNNFMYGNANTIDAGISSFVMGTSNVNSASNNWVGGEGNYNLSGNSLIFGYGCSANSGSFNAIIGKFNTIASGGSTIVLGDNIYASMSAYLYTTDVVQRVSATNSALIDLPLSSMSYYIDEGANQLKIKVKYSTGVEKTGTINLV